MPNEILAWAIRSPQGKIITWTCFVTTPEHSWLQYFGVDRMEPSIERAIEKKKEEGYSVVRVRISPEPNDKEA